MSEIYSMCAPLCKSISTCVFFSSVARSECRKDGGAVAAVLCNVCVRIVPTKHLVFEDNYSFRMGSNGCANLLYAFFGQLCIVSKLRNGNNSIQCLVFFCSVYYQFDQDLVAHLL